MVVNKVTSASQSAEEWSKLLKKTGQKGKDDVHQYVILKTGGDQDQYTIEASSDFKAGSRKMSIPEIVKISQERLIEVKENLESQTYLTHAQVNRFSKLSSDITANTQLIIDAREAKRD